MHKYKRNQHDNDPADHNFDLPSHGVHLKSVVIIADRLKKGNGRIIWTGQCKVLPELAEYILNDKLQTGNIEVRIDLCFVRTGEYDGEIGIGQDKQHQIAEISAQRGE